MGVLSLTPKIRDFARLHGIFYPRISVGSALISVKRCLSLLQNSDLGNEATKLLDGAKRSISWPLKST